MAGTGLFKPGLADRAFVSCSWFPIRVRGHFWIEGLEGGCPCHGECSPWERQFLSRTRNRAATAAIRAGGGCSRGKACSTHPLGTHPLGTHPSCEGTLPSRERGWRLVEQGQDSSLPRQLPPLPPAAQCASRTTLRLPSFPSISSHSSCGKRRAAPVPVCQRLAASLASAHWPSPAAPSGRAPVGPPSPPSPPARPA